MAYLKITSLGSLNLRVEGKADALVAISSAIMRSPNGRDTSLDDDSNHSMGIFNDQRNDRKCRSLRKWPTLHRKQGTLGM